MTKAKKTNSGGRRGGVRAGAGRPKNDEPFENIRVPTAIAKDVKHLISQYKTFKKHLKLACKDQFIFTPQK